MKILVINGGTFGDLLMITPAIRGLKEKYQHAHIFFSGKSQKKIVLQHNRFIARILPRYRRKQYRFIEANFDLAYDYHRHVTLNPEADVKNAYDTACERADVRPTSMLPEFYYTEDELREARAILEDKGVDKARDRLILVHIETPALSRRLPDETGITVATHLADKGYKVAFIGLDRDIASRFGGVHKNVVFLSDLVSRHTTRVMFCVARYADCLIAIDGVFSHLGAALGIPSVLLYGAFDARPRAKYFSRAMILQACVRCGPCQQVDLECVRYPEQIAPCMQSFGAEEIVDAAERVLAGEPTHAMMTDSDFSKNDSRNCPLCGEMETRLLARKGSFCYLACAGCKSFYLDRTLNTEELVREYDEQYLEEQQHVHANVCRQVNMELAQLAVDLAQRRRLRPRRLLDVGCGCGWLLDGVRKRRWECEGIEINDVMAHQARDRGHVVRAENFESSVGVDKHYSIVTLVNTFQSFQDQKRALRRLWNILERPGLAILWSPCADSYSGRNSWPPFNTAFCGENACIPSRSGLLRVAREVGFAIDEYRSFPALYTHLCVLDKC